MSSKIIAWVSSKGRNLLNKSSRKPKSWAKKIISKLPYQRKLNTKEEWKKENQSTMDFRDVLSENLRAAGNSNNASKESCTQHRPPLMTACFSGHTEKVKSLLEEDVDINEQDEEGTTALILACLGGHTEIVEMLLNKGALVDMQDKEKWTALMKAADNGLTEVVNLLLEHRAQVDTQSEWRKTSLMLASQKGNVEVVQLLLEHDAGVDLQDYQGWTALMLASKNGHNKATKLLLQQGAKVDLRTDAGTALMWASEEGHEEVVKLLLEHGAQVNLCSDIGETALMWACDTGHSDIAKLLLEYGAQVDLRKKRSGETALLRASKKGYDEVVKVLLEHCAQADLQTGKGESALMCASEGGHYAVAKLLLECSVRVNLQDSEGQSALMLASSRGHIEVINLLVEHGAQVCMKDIYNEFSILICACRQGNAEVVKVLLSKGCDVQINEPNCRGETALMYASRGEVAKVLLDHGAQVDIQNIDGRTALMLAASNGHIEVVEVLLEHGAQVTLQDRYGSSTLMHACSQKKSDIVKMLLGRGCVPLIHQLDNYGKTALMCASEKGHYDVAEVLIENGAQVDFQDKKGHTALIYASREGCCEVVKLLIKHGAQVDFQDKKRKTALIYASRKGHIQVAKILLEHHAQIDLKGKRELSYGECSFDSEQTALMMAHSTEAAQFLLEHGAQVNLCVNLRFSDNSSLVFSEDYADIGVQVEGHAEGLTALMLAPAFQNYKYMKLLLEHDAKVDLQAKAVISLTKRNSCIPSESIPQVDEKIKGEIEGITALMCAAASRLTTREGAEILLKHSAQIDMQTTGAIEGVTALMLAAICGNKKVVGVLLDNGAQIDLRAKGNIHFFPFFGSVVGQQSDYGEAAMLMLQHGALGNLCMDHEVEGFTALMCAVVFGHGGVTRLLLEHGAQVNIQAKGVMKGKTALTLALITEHYKEAKLLLNHGADVDSQDDEGFSPLMHAVQAQNYKAVKFLIANGADIDLQNNDSWSPLMYAVQVDNLEVVELLIQHGANIHLKNDEGKTIHDICSPDLKADPKYTKALLRTDANLEMDSKFPGITFFCRPLWETLTSRENTIGELCDGLSMYVPTNALSSEDELAELSIRPCFNGPFEFPAEYKPVSPAYLIRHSKTHFQKDITIRMHHYANLQSEKDCEDMAFLTANSTPEYRGEQPVYVFKEIPGARGVFKPGDQVGEISLQHFCLVIAGKQKTTSDLYYSARLYRDPEHHGTVSAAVFCMCLYHPIYIKHCDAMISKKYTGEKSADFVQVREDSIVIHSNDPSGQHVKFDKVPAQILRSEVHLPEILNIDVGELLDYPPRLSISVKTSQDFTSPVLQVHGLNKECGYNLLPITTPFITPPVGNSSETEQMSPETQNYPTPPPHQSQFTEREDAPSSLPLSSQHKDTVTEDTAHSNFLDIDDLSDVLDEVESLSSKWRLLLTKLGVKRSALECVKTNNAGDAKMCLYEALGEWLMLNYDHQRHGRPSWSKLVKAVSSIDFALSETIAKKIC